MICLLLVDDQPIVRQGLRSLLEAQSEFRVVGEAENGEEAIAQAETLQPDIILMDVRMPVMNGVIATRAIHTKFPDIKILVLTTFDDDEYVFQAVRCGAKGYLLKDTDSQEIAQAIRTIHKGHAQFGPGLLEKVLADPALPQAASPLTLPDKLQQLTPRERQVICLVIKGASNREIAQKLCISERTVKNHMTHIFARLDVRDRTQAAMFASPFLSQLEEPI